VLRNAQERLHAVERAFPDCEVLLHDPSTLSRIVACEKRSYIWLDRNLMEGRLGILTGVRGRAN
jgi:hypothetical protein